MCNERADGGTFGDMTKTSAAMAKKRNAMQSMYSGDFKQACRAVDRCFWRLLELSAEGKLSKESEKDFRILFDFCNLGRYNMCVQLKETADLLRDADLVGPDTDPWKFEDTK